jgi:hypothetical protein
MALHNALHRGQSDPGSRELLGIFESLKGKLERKTGTDLFVSKENWDRFICFQ